MARSRTWREILDRGMAALDRGSYPEAERLLEEAVAHADDRGDRALTLNNLGAVRNRLGRRSDARRAYMEAIGAWERVPDGNPLVMAAVMRNLTALQHAGAGLPAMLLRV